MDKDEALLDAFEAREVARINAEFELKRLAQTWLSAFQSPFANAAKQAHGVRFDIRNALALEQPYDYRIDKRSWDDLGESNQRGLISDAQHVAEHPSTTVDELWIRQRKRPFSEGGDSGEASTNEEPWELDEPSRACESAVLDKLRIALLENLPQAYRLSFQSPFEKAAKQAHGVRVDIHKAKNLVPKKNGGMDISAWDEIDDRIRHALISDAQYVAEHPSVTQETLRIRYQDRWIAEANKGADAESWTHADLDEWDDPTLECENEILKQLKIFLAENLERANLERANFTR